MAKKSESHAGHAARDVQRDGHADDPDQGSGAGHHGAEETEESRRDRERSEAVERAWRRGLRKPGLVLACIFGALSLAWLASLGDRAPAMMWTWLLLLLYGFGWSLALSRGDADDAQAPTGGSPAPH